MRHLLYLIGNMGSGKTTVGERESPSGWDLPFCDLDQRIEQANRVRPSPSCLPSGASAPFRDLESRELLTADHRLPAPEAWSPQAAGWC
jgi:shikimate kinase